MSSSSSYSYFSGVTGVGIDPVLSLDFFFFLNKLPKLPVLFVSFLGLLRDTDTEGGFLVDSGTEVTADGL